MDNFIQSFYWVIYRERASVFFDFCNEFNAFSNQTGAYFSLFMQMPRMYTYIPHAHTLYKSCITYNMYVYIYIFIYVLLCMYHVHVNCTIFFISYKIFLLNCCDWLKLRKGNLRNLHEFWNNYKIFFCWRFTV